MSERVTSNVNYYKAVIQSSIVWAICVSLFESLQIVVSTSVRYLEPWDIPVISIALFIAYSGIWFSVLMAISFFLKPFFQKRRFSNSETIIIFWCAGFLLYQLFWTVYEVGADRLLFSSSGLLILLAKTLSACLVTYAIFKVAEVLRDRGLLKQIKVKLFSLSFCIMAYMVFYIYLKSTSEHGTINAIYSFSLFVLVFIFYNLLNYLVKRLRPVLTISGLMGFITKMRLMVIMALCFISLLCFAYYGLAKKNDISLKPNILFISIDTLRADRLSCYGEIKKKTSPNIDRIAQEGYLFKKAYSPTTWTLPGHASMMTGLFPSSHKADRSLKQTMSRPVDPLPSSAKTLAEILNDAGYNTGGIISNPFVSSSFGMDQGFQFYDDQVDIFEDIRYLSLKDDSMLFKLLMVLKIIDGNDYDGEKRVLEVNEKALNWLEEKKDEKNPFFLFLHYNEPHFTYEPPAPYNKSNDGRYIDFFMDIERLNAGRYSLSSWGLNDLLTLYDGEITYLDHHLGMIFEKLEEWNISKKTIVIITSDHGESFNEHEIWQHGNSLYEEQIKVPLIIRYPELMSGGHVVDNHLVQTIDVMPTLLDILDIRIPDNVQGRSLVPFFKGKSVDSRFDMAFAEIRPDINWRVQNPRYGDGIKAVINKDWKYILYDNGREELYNLNLDPDESNNLVKSEKVKANEMREILDSWSYVVTPEKDSKKGKIDSGRLEQLRSLGYLK